MPPKQKYSRELIIQTAKAIIERDGVECLSHRTIAKELGCSTQPIMSNFKSMDEVRLAVRQAIDLEITAHIQNDVKTGVYAMVGAVYAYIEYAAAHPNLFLFLVLDSRIESYGGLLLAKMDPSPLLADLACSVGLTPEGVKRVYAHCWLFSHGVAIAKATGACPFSMEELKGLIDMNTHGVIKELKERGYGLDQ